MQLQPAASSSIVVMEWRNITAAWCYQFVLFDFEQKLRDDGHSGEAIPYS